MFFLIKSKFNFIGLIVGWVTIITIPFKEKGNKVSKPTLEYLDKVEARIVY